MLLVCYILAVLDCSLSGVSLVGIDKSEQCSEELLIRWLQLAAFLPFLRSVKSAKLECRVRIVPEVLLA